MNGRSVSLALILFSAAHAATARADHPAVEEGRQALAAAEFRRAIEAFDEAERGPLDRDAYIALLEGRALASWASGDEARARADLAALAAVDPEHVFPPEAPPDVTDLFAESVAARAGPLAATATFSPTGDQVIVTVENDDTGLVTRVRGYVRPLGGSWSVAEADPPAAAFPVPRAPGASAEAWAELLGPGGAVLATAGSEQAPIAWRSPHAAQVPADEPRLLRETDTGTEEDDGSTTLWVALGVGGAAVLAAVVLSWVVLSGGGEADGAQPGRPMVMGF